MRFGTNYGGFVYPKNLPGLNENSVIYCVGVGEDISHDILVSYITKAPIFLFDPTLRSIVHVNEVKSVLDSGIEPPYNSRLGGGAQDYWKLILDHPISSDNIFFSPIGLYTENVANMKFYKPNNPEYVSHSLVEKMKSDEYTIVPVKTLKSLMSDCNHDHIDLLKIDIEGVECEVLAQMLDANILPMYVSVDFDSARGPTTNLSKCENIVQRMLKAGYEILHFHMWDISFIHSSNSFFRVEK